jgi:hypothetical protein
VESARGGVFLVEESARGGEQGSAAPACAAEGAAADESRSGGAGRRWRDEQVATRRGAGAVTEIGRKKKPAGSF